MYCMKNYTIFLVPATLLMMAHKILSPDFVIHNPVLPEVLRNGPEGAKKYASAIITAVPN